MKAGLLAGLSLADISFAIGISRVTRRVRDRLLDANLLWRVPCDKATNLFGDDS